MTTFLAEGGNALYLTAEVEDARFLQRQFNLLAMGEKSAKTIAGFDFDNSPLALLRARDRIRGRSGVITTSNGTGLIKLLTSLGGVVLAGSFLNLSACVSKAAELLSNGGLVPPALPAAAPDGIANDGLVRTNPGTGIVVACAGRRGIPVLDDTYCAGVFVNRLHALLPGAELRDGALIAQAVSQALPREEALDMSESGQVTAQLGLQDEVDFCARIDVYSCVPRAVIEGEYVVMKA
jgi:2-phosphosulfolactate phosphatase